MSHLGVKNIRSLMQPTTWFRPMSFDIQMKKSGRLVMVVLKLSDRLMMHLIRVTHPFLANPKTGLLRICHLIVICSKNKQNFRKIIVSSLLSLLRIQLRERVRESRYKERDPRTPLHRWGDIYHTSAIITASVRLRLRLVQVYEVGTWVLRT